MEVVFCKTRADPHHYRSYTDFWRLVELSGFEVVWLDELEPGRDAVYVITPKNGELPAVLLRLQGQHRCKAVWWCLERPGQDGTVTHGAPLPPGLDQLWVSDLWLAQLEGWPHYAKARHVVLGTHRGLVGGPVPVPVVQRYDWIHLSYTNPRRKAVYEAIGGRVAPNCWGFERDVALFASRFMVNVHQDDHLVLEPLRFALAAAYRLPIISEWVNNPWPYRSGIDADFWPMNELADRCWEAVGSRREDHYRDLAERCWDRMCQQFPFERCVNLAAQELWHAG